MNIHKTPKQVEALSGVLKATQDSKQGKGNKAFWLSTKTNKDGSTKYVGIHRNHPEINRNDQKKERGA